LEISKIPRPILSVCGFKNRIDTNPDFQRPAVWSLGQKQLLVEPRSDIVDRLDSLEIKVIWREKKVFLDNVNGQFT
jgi:hypothetical protein